MNSIAVKLSDKDLDPMLKKLHLANTRRTWKETVDRAEKEDWSYRDFLALLVMEEVAHREQTRIMRSVRKAGFPFLKTIDEYDFSLRSNVRRGLFGSYLGPELISEGRNLILMGKTGRGKTHLAVAIAYRAIQNGFTAKFTTAAVLIEELSEAGKEGKLRQALKEYISPAVLVIDEVGYLTYGPEAANVLFHVVNERHILNRPILFTTNKSPFEEWGDALHDKDLAEAIVDRVLEKGRIVVLDGPSARTRHLGHQMASKGKIDKPAIISGIKRQQFPESTPHSESSCERRGRNPENGVAAPESTTRSHAVSAFLWHVFSKAFIFLSVSSGTSHRHGSLFLSM